jgi:hypothetical protein
MSGNWTASSLPTFAPREGSDVNYPVESAVYQWEEGDRRVSELSRDTELAPILERAMEAVRDELRRRIGPSFTAADLAELYSQGTDWCLAAARRTDPERASALDPQAVTDGAFWRHLRSASDWAGGRVVPIDEDEEDLS